MVTWERVSVRARTCGRCGRQLTLGDPILVYTFTSRHARGGTVSLIRCDDVKCGGPAPPDLPAIIERKLGIGPTPTLRPWAEIDALRNREPGEEG